jgi:hypothetical protein
MIEIHRGLGIMVPLIGILSALLMNMVTIKFFDNWYYQEHVWPKLVVLLLAGFSCLVFGIWLKRKRLRNAEKEQLRIDSLRPMNEGIKLLAFGGPRDHLMFIPVQYWSIAYFLAAIIYGVRSYWVS